MARADPARAARTSARARRSWRSRSCARGGSRWGRCWSASSAISPPGLGSTTRSRSLPAPPRSTWACGRWDGGPGDEVVTTPFSFVASANCLLYEGATPVFCDVDPVTLNLDPSAARDAVTDRTAGVLPVDILGYPAALPEAGGAGRRRRPGPAGGRLRGARRGGRGGRPGRRPGKPGHLRRSTPTSS